MARGRAKLAMSQGLSVWVLDAPDGFGEAPFHAHHAIQLSFALDGDLMLATRDSVLRGSAIAVAADAEHRFEAKGLLAFLFVEPESRAGRALKRQLFQEAPLVALDIPGLGDAVAPLARAFEPAIDQAALQALGEAVVARIVPAAPAPLVDARVQRLIDYAAANLHAPLSLADAAHGVHLSGSRLRHLFVEQTGLAFKTYVLWLRLVRAVQVYSEGHSLTEAAHAAGFSDSAHLSRIFRRTFGLPATTLTRL